MEQHYLAIDLGAESGRVVLGTLSEGRVELSEIHRFITGAVIVPVRYPGNSQNTPDSEVGLLWNFYHFWEEIKTGIRMAMQDFPISSMGVDSWGVDFALLDSNGELLGCPYHYRDARTNGMMEKAFERLPRQRIYQLTGNGFTKLNTLFQLLSLEVNQSPFLEIADRLVMLPDLINYWLTGKVVSEFSQATTTQMFEPKAHQWSGEILGAMGIDPGIFPEVVNSSTRIGGLRQFLVDELGADCTVVAPVTHDTASAVAAIPASADDFVWISSGTWSLVGINTPQPIMTEQSYGYQFTNEGGRDGSFYLCKNLSGLWAVQQCRRQWQTEGKPYSYAELTQMAEQAPHLRSIVDPQAEAFQGMGNMVGRIQEYCLKTSQPVPETEGEIIRAVLQGLALRYRQTIDQLVAVSGKKLDVIHIVGGGSQNQLLNQFTADACGRKVICGPIEATAIGNIIAQAIAMGDLQDWNEGLEVVRSSFDRVEYHPQQTDNWHHAYLKFIDLL